MVSENEPISPTLPTTRISPPTSADASRTTPPTSTSAMQAKAAASVSSVLNGGNSASRPIARP